MVVCFDECGPLELRPIHGQTWSSKQHPHRLRGTYNRYKGTEQFLGFYDYHNDCLAGIIRRRKTVDDLLAVFRRLRCCYPFDTKLYVIMDNLSSHKNYRLAEYMAKSNIIPVWTPTYSSWLNAIECHFAPLKKFTLHDTDDRDHMVRRKRIYRYLNYRNQQSRSTSCSLHRYRYVKLERH